MRRNRWAVAAMVALAVGAGAGANAVDENHLATGWRTIARGAEGTDVVAASYQVHVHGAASSAQLDDRELITSTGVFVAVDLSYATTDSWHEPAEIVLLDGEGREFSHPRLFGSSGGPWPAGPDIWYRGTLLFEVPADVVDDLTLELRPDLRPRIIPSTVVRIPLTVTASSEPLTLEDATLLAAGER